ncbi:MAG TPA: penicillin acylase family protein, partial [Rubrobacteraceae bacterium]|nr:penicillin acylase family protein [Rubrobacteraceae bacterium]
MRLAHSLLETFSRALGGATRPLLDRFTRGSLPGLEGTAKLAGLEGTVEVLRDRYGVPQVFASNERDLFFGQGYVHAQDRFFQMEIGRRAGHGRVSELLGESALELDRLSRTIGFSRISASEKSPPPEALQALEAYSAGVNAFLTNEPLPPELLLLRHVPEPWRPADTAAWSVVIAWSLSATWEAKLLHAAGEEGALDKEALHPLIDPGLGSSGGSNAWAVAPERSASGSAMM